MGGGGTAAAQQGRLHLQHTALAEEGTQCRQQLGAAAEDIPVRGRTPVAHRVRLRAAAQPPRREVSPRTPGSVSATTSSTKLGGATARGWPLYKVTMHISWPLSHFAASPTTAGVVANCS